MLNRVQSEVEPVCIADDDGAGGVLLGSSRVEAEVSRIELLAPTVAACAVCGGRTILSPGLRSMSPSAVWNTIWPRTQYSTFS